LPKRKEWAHCHRKMLRKGGEEVKKLLGKAALESLKRLARTPVQEKNKKRRKTKKQPHPTNQNKRDQGLAPPA